MSNEGELTLSLPQLTETQGTLALYFNPEADAPQQTLTIDLSHLDPIETPSGIQARCNNLGYACGDVDSHLGDLSREGVSAFQANHGLIVDGDPGPKTQKKLKDLYGL